MDLNLCITRLSNNRDVIAALLKGVSAEQARWKATPDKWSLLEIINHLFDEERDDFRTRLRLTLFEPGQTWPAIDPQGWVISREYGNRDFELSIKNFLNERDVSLGWLTDLKEKELDWQAKYDHPQGILKAGDLISSWVAHDLLHIRQITRLHWEYLNQQFQPFSSDYAGNW